MRSAGRRRFRETQFASGLRSARLMASNVMEVTVGKVISLAPNFFNSASILDFLNRFVLTLAGLWTMT